MDHKQVFIIRDESKYKVGVALSEMTDMFYKIHKTISENSTISVNEISEIVKMLDKCEARIFEIKAICIELVST